MSITNKNYFDELLLKTVENAARNPFYQKFWPATAAQNITDTASFRQLPILHKDTYLDEFENIAPHPSDIMVVHHTGGTTGQPMFRYRTQREIQTIAQFMLHVHQHQPQAPNGSEGPEPILLSEVDPYHGTPIPMPVNGLVLSGSAESAGTLSHARETLLKPFNIDGFSSHVTHLLGTELFMVMLALDLQNVGKDPASLGIQGIFTRGHYLSSYWRDFLERTWGVPVGDSFSLSEVLGSAPRCLKRRTCHFEPLCYAEFLHPDSLEPVQEGLAMLVLTELYPYIQHQPFIRYWTGDLVEVVQDSDDPRLPGFIPKGRLKKSVTDPREGTVRVLIPAYDLIESIDRFPEIARKPLADWIEERFGPQHFGEAMVSATVRGDTVEILLKPAFSARLYAEKAEDLATRFGADLLSRCEPLRSATNNGAYRLDVKAVDELPDGVNSGYDRPH